jgi:hypothetical protein
VAVIIFIEFHANLGDGVNIPNPIFIQEMQKFNEFFYADRVIILPKGHKGHNHRVLHFDFIYQYDFTSSLPKFVENKRARNRRV